MYIYLLLVLCSCAKLIFLILVRAQNLRFLVYKIKSRTKITVLSTLKERDREAETENPSVFLLSKPISFLLSVSKRPYAPISEPQMFG